MAFDLRVSDTAGKVASRATPKITGLTGPSSLTSRVTGGVHSLKTTSFTTEGVWDNSLVLMIVLLNQAVREEEEILEAE